MSIKRLLLIGILFFGVAAILTSQTVKIGSVSGKVEVKKPGMSWEKADEGMSLPINSMISTGFGSEAKILMDNADITIKALTRMTIQEFVSSGNTTTTKLFLGAGKMRADVRRSDNMINDFQVRSPVATAAVRGTSFTFDGMRLEVVKGSVDLAGKKGGKVNVSQGGRSEVAEDSGATDPAVTRREDSGVSPTTSSGEDSGSPTPESTTIDDGGSIASPSPEPEPEPDPTATLEITLE